MVTQNVLKSWKNTITTDACLPHAAQICKLRFCTFNHIIRWLPNRPSFWCFDPFDKHQARSSFWLPASNMDSLLIQSWTLYAVSVSVIVARLAFRRIMLKSFADLQTDDWIMVLLLLPLTASTVLTVSLGDSEPDKQSTYRYVLEELQIVMVWLVKACLLVLYWRIL